MIHTRIYSLSVGDTEYEIAHLYEHLMLRKLNAALRVLETPSYLNVHWRGDTYAEHIFIMFDTTNDKAAAILDSFLQSKGKYSKDDIRLELSRIENEEKSILFINNTSQLYKELDKLDQRSWTNLQHYVAPAESVSHSKESNRDEIIMVQPLARKFRDITLALGIENATPDELALFSRLNLILTDMLYDFMNDEGMYVRTGSDAFRDYNAIATSPHHALALLIIGVKRGSHTLKDVERITGTALIEFQDSLNAKQLKNEFEIRESMSSTSDFSSRVYDRLGIYVSQRQITALVTKESIKAILDKLTIKAVQTKPEHWDYI